MPPIFEDSLNLSLLSDTHHLLLGIPNFEYFHQYLESSIKFLSLPIKFLETREYTLLIFVFLTK